MSMRALTCQQRLHLGFARCLRRLEFCDGVGVALDNIAEGVSDGGLEYLASMKQMRTTWYRKPKSIT